MMMLVGSITAFFAGAFIAFVVTNSIRTKQIENLKQELKLERQERQRVEGLLKQCNAELEEVHKAYTETLIELKRREIDYARKMKEYADKVRQLNIAERYNLQAEGEDTCTRMKNLLDKLVEVER